MSEATLNHESDNYDEQFSPRALLRELAARLPPAPSPAPSTQETENLLKTQMFIDFFRGIGWTSPVVPAAESNHTTPSLSMGSTPNASPALATPPAPSALSVPLPSFYDCGDYQPHVHTGIVASPEVNAPTLPHSILPVPEPDDRDLDDEDIRHRPATDTIACRWKGGCGEHAHYLKMWLHIFGTGKKNVAVPIPGKHLDGTDSVIRCLWSGCTNKVAMRSDSLKRHIETKHLHITVQCTWCGVDRREDAYKSSHRPARFCDQRPTDPDARRTILSRRAASAVPSPTLPSAAGPVRPKRTRAPRKKAQQAIAYPSPTDVSGSVPHQGRRTEQRSIRPRPVAGPSSSSHSHTSMSAFLPSEPFQASFHAPQQSHSMAPQVSMPGPAFVQGSSTGRGTGPNTYQAPIAPAPMPPMYGYSSAGFDRAAGMSFSQPQPQYFDQPTAGPSSFLMNAPAPFLMNAPAPVPTRRAPMQRRAPLQPAASVDRQVPPMGQMNFPQMDFPFVSAANPMPLYTPDTYKYDSDPFSMWPASDAENRPPYCDAPY